MAPEAPQALHRVAEPEGADPSTAVFEPGAIERLLATLDDDGPTLVADLIATFMEEAPTLLATLGEALASGQAEEVRRAAHSLKSSAASLGATRFSSLCRELEMAARAGELDTAKGLDAGLDAEYGRARDALEAVAETLERGARHTATS